MNAEAMWHAFTTIHPEAEGAAYEAWSYVDAPDELLALTLSGRKRATASALPLYALADEALPVPGEYSILLDSRGKAACVLLTTTVSVAPFDAVTADFAAREGEGDLSLAHWRKIHESYFTRVMTEAGLIFSPDMQVVCEEFEVVYR